MGDKRSNRDAQYWKLTSLLLLCVAGLVLAALSLPAFSTGLLIAALPIAVSALLIIRSQRLLIEEMHASLERQLPIDSSTGATSFFWFQQMLEQECRRAMREFSPVSVIRLLPIKSDQSLHQSQLIETLQVRMTRPGDLVALDEKSGLWLLLPSTNETIQNFAERLFKVVNQDSVSAHLICFTFQPTADLNRMKVFDILQQLEAKLHDDNEAKFLCDAEGFDMPSVTYSL